MIVSSLDSQLHLLFLCQPNPGVISKMIKLSACIRLNQYLSLAWAKALTLAVSPSVNRSLPVCSTTAIFRILDDKIFFLSGAFSPSFEAGCLTTVKLFALLYFRNICHPGPGCLLPVYPFQSLRCKIFLRDVTTSLQHDRLSAGLE